MLVKAIDLVARTCERMPAPGTLSKAISDIRGTSHCGPSTKYAYTKTVVKDTETGQMVNAIVYDDDPAKLCFKAADCKEGREFLALMAKLKTAPRTMSERERLRLAEEQARQERNRQKAAAAVLSDANQIRTPEHHSASPDSVALTAAPAAIAVQPVETAPEDLAEEQPYIPTDEDVPW